MTHPNCTGGKSGTSEVTRVTPSELRFVAIVPALNEAACIGRVVQQLGALVRRDGTPALTAVVVGDNGSTDDTGAVAKAAGAAVARAQFRGYGHGCMAAIAAAPSADVYVFVDGDDTLNYADIEPLLRAIERGADIAIGRRTQRARHSMSFAQRMGNALCCGLIRLLWRADIHDLGPLRAMRASAFHALDMQAFTYGWTLEMQVKAVEQQLVMVEIPVSTLARRTGTSKVSSTLVAAMRCGRVMLLTIFLLWRTRDARMALFTANRATAQNARTAPPVAIFCYPPPVINKETYL